MGDWRKYRFTDYVDFNPRVKLKENTEYSFIEMSDLGPDNKFASPRRKRAPNGLTKFEEGDTLFAKITPCLENGNICQAKNLENGVGVGSTEFYIFRGKQGISDNDFVYYLLKSYPVKQYAIRNMTGSAGQQRVPSDVFKSLILKLPDYEESKKIGAFLSQFDKQISLLRRQNEILEEMAQAIFKHWFVDFEFPMSAEQAAAIGKPELEGKPYRSNGGKMVESGSEFGEVPEGWEIKTISNVVDVKRGGSPRPIHDYIQDHGLPWVKISDATAENSPFLFSTKEFIKETGLKKTVFLKAGSLILSNSATPGIPKFLELDACIHDGWLYFKKIHEVSYIYLYLYFKLIKPNLLQQGSGSVFKNLKTDILKQYLIAIPDRSIFLNFEYIASSIFEKMKLNSIQINSLIAIRDLLLPKLMSGLLTV